MVTSEFRGSWLLHGLVLVSPLGYSGLHSSQPLVLHCSKKCKQQKKKLQHFIQGKVLLMLHFYLSLTYDGNASVQNLSNHTSGSVVHLYIVCVYICLLCICFIWEHHFKFHTSFTWTCFLIHTTNTVMLKRQITRLFTKRLTCRKCPVKLHLAW